MRQPEIIPSVLRMSKLAAIVIVAFTMGLFGTVWVHAQERSSAGNGDAGLNRKMSSETVPGNTSYPHANATAGAVQRFAKPPLRPKRSPETGADSQSVRDPANPSGRKDPNWRYPNDANTSSH